MRASDDPTDDPVRPGWRPGGSSGVAIGSSVQRPWRPGQFSVLPADIRLRVFRVFSFKEISLDSDFDVDSSSKASPRYREEIVSAKVATLATRRLIS